MNIKKANLKYNKVLTPLNKSHVVGLALHHMAHPTADIPTIHGWHLNRGFIGFGYNWWISLTGEIFEGRGDNVGAAVLNRNSTVISIGFQGNYHRINGVVHRTTMPDAQFDAGVRLIEKLKKDYPNIRVVHGHKYWQNTACPGEFFPLAELIAGKLRTPEVQTDPLEAAVQTLVDKGIINSPDYWVEHARQGKTVNGISAWHLINKMASYLRGGK